MPVIDINGVLVKFPYQPYDVQRNYMEKVIEALDKGENAILESPTGTGKTLSLLCATLAWIDVQKRVQYPKCVPKVIFASRTHSQILQAMNALKESDYSHFKAGVVASRDQLCVDEELKKKSNTDKTHICNARMKNTEIEENCKYYLKVDGAVLETKVKERKILDIEDLHEIATEFECCPYYMSKQRNKDAEIVFMPYNYLLDPNIRHTNQVDLKGSIIILDEAHNVEKMCEDSACTYITSTNIGIAIRDLTYILKNASLLEVDEYTNITDKDVEELKSSIQKLKTEVLNIRIKDFKGDAYPGDYIFSLLEKAGINEHSSEYITKMLFTLIGNLAVQPTAKNCPEGKGLRAISSFLRIVFSNSSPQLRAAVNRCYKVFIEKEPDKLTYVDGGTVTDKAQYNAKKINLWCFSAAFGMHYLLSKKVRSLILTSGTLAPLKPLMTEMALGKAILLKNPHIIKPFQVCVKVVPIGPDKIALNSSFKNRDKEEYIRSIGKTVLEFSKVIPDGLLVFFPSYVVMNKCVSFWQKNGIFSLISEQKSIFLEEKTKTEFEAAMYGYYAAINDPNSKGAIFLAVMRGKVSEGLDFADMYGRGVIVTGIPFGPCMEPKIVLKKQYLNENRTVENEMLSGDEWYFVDAARAINQAIGRVIRHNNDYGAILFCDDRLQHSRNQRDISDWIKDHLKALTLEDFDTTVDDLQKFYENAKRMLPEPKPKHRSDLEICFEEDINETHMEWTRNWDLTVPNGNNNGVGNTLNTRGNGCCNGSACPSIASTSAIARNLMPAGMPESPLKKMKLNDT